MLDTIVIIDYGSQFTQLIARVIRNQHIFCIIQDYDQTIDSKNYNIKGIILSGSPQSVEDDHQVSAEIYALNVPILGICYGMQLLAKSFGGKISSSENREFGCAELTNMTSELFNHLVGIFDGDKKMQVWMSHADSVTKVPTGFSTIAKTDSCEIAAIANLEKKYFGVQFHPEVSHTNDGDFILKNFTYDICGCKRQWTTKHFIKNTIETIQQKVQNEKVILGLSGGVDSTVVAKIIHNAIGEQLICVFINNGLLRLNEVDAIITQYKEMNLNIHYIDAKENFYNHLKGIVDPEEKRKIIGKIFIDEFKQAVSGAKFLAQGTIYPDIIESSGSKFSHNIKSHHNVGGLPEDLHLTLIEPLKLLFKDEVRKLGTELGIPAGIINRHPFPGPGLAIRIIGEVKLQFIEMLQKADNIFIEELKNTKQYNKLSQAFAVFLPIKTVGVMGDTRTYEYVIALRAVETVNFMTAKIANLSVRFIQQVSNRIINEVVGINRVVYDVSSKPPATIEWE